MGRGYEVLLSLAYSAFGLLGIGAVGTALTVAVALTIFSMLERLSGRFWTAWFLTAITCSAFLFNGSPRPVFLSYIFYCVVLEGAHLPCRKRCVLSCIRRPLQALSMLTFTASL
jgi:hypothetical protein